MNKKCTKCGIEKPLTTEYYHRCKKGKYGFKEACKICRNYLTREYKKINRGKLEKENVQKQYYKKKKEKILLNAKKRYLENSDIYKRRSKIYLQTKNGKENKRISRQKRDAIEREVLHSMTLGQWKVCLENFGHKCAYCGSDNGTIEQDHFIPLSKGGEYTIKNIIPACSKCNRNKYTSLFFEWYPKQIFYSKTREQRILNYLGYKNKRQQISLF